MATIVATQQPIGNKLQILWQYTYTEGLVKIYGQVYVLEKPKCLRPQKLVLQQLWRDSNTKLRNLDPLRVNLCYRFGENPFIVLGSRWVQIFQTLFLLKVIGEPDHNGAQPYHGKSICAKFEIQCGQSAMSIFIKNCHV